METAKVLLIDDERGLRRNLSVGLMQRGFEMVPCQDGFSALNTLDMYVERGMPINYVVTDICLPDIDGLKLLKVIKSRYPNLPVFVISGYGDESTHMIVEKERGDGYLDKPFSAEDLIQLLRTAKSPWTAAREAGAVALDTGLQKESASAYILLHLDERSVFQDVYRSLYFMDKVLYCDAVIGDCHVILLVQSSSPKDILRWAQSKLIRVEGVVSADVVEVIKPMISEATRKVICTVESTLEKEKGINEKQRRLDKRVSSYVMLEIEPEYFEEIYKRVYFMEDVVYCDATHGSYGMVLLIQSPTFDLIKKRVAELSRNIDGILKVKQYQIMNLLEM